MRERLRRALPAIIGLALFMAALAVLRSELRALSWHELTTDVLSTSARPLAAALLLTVLNYLTLTAYDLLAFAYIGKRLARGRIMLASFLAYAIANNVGFAAVSGASVRYRFYSRWGVTAEELSRLFFSYSMTFWLGLLTVGGLSLALSPLPQLRDLALAPIVAPIGWLFVLVSVTYLVATVVRRRPVRLWAVTLPLPSFPLALGQLTISVSEWTMAGGVLFVLLPSSDLTLPVFLGAFFAAQLLGMASHVPGGVGIFEGLMVLMLKPFLSSAELLPALVVYRVVYYLLPLTVALIVFVVDEARERRAHFARVGALFGWLAESVTPRVIAAFTFIAGLILLISGATPAAAGRLAALGRLLPLGVIETSHFVGSLVGAALLLLSQSLARRLDAAHALTVGALTIGIAASLGKGADVEEAALLTGLLLVLWRARPAFDRRAALFDAPFSMSWAALVIAALATSVWLGLFAFGHVNYANELWWQFEVHGEASRFLRATVGAAVVMLLFAVSRLLRHAPPEIQMPTDQDMTEAMRIIATQSSTSPFLACLRDKTLLFNESRTGFVMYAVQGRTWVALGDPVGPPDDQPALIRSFLERCDDYGGVPVFYEVRKDALHHYADMGLAFVKLGEEAIIDLKAFSFEGSHASRHRQALRRLEKTGCTFRVIHPEQVPALLDQLRAVSDDWLAHKSGAEKGFSLGFFDREYISRFPVAAIERDDRVLAFGTLWPGPQHEELSVDLMRYRRDAPNGVMEMLFAHIIKWGQDDGFRRFALGMAPLSGVDASPVGPLWNRLGAFLFEHGEAVYHFQGLRAFKDKFDPIWEPRYLAYEGGMRLPRILADVAALIAGGYRGIVLKRRQNAAHRP